MSRNYNEWSKRTMFIRLRKCWIAENGVKRQSIMSNGLVIPISSIVGWQIYISYKKTNEDRLIARRYSKLHHGGLILRHAPKQQLHGYSPRQYVDSFLRDSSDTTCIWGRLGSGTCGIYLSTPLVQCRRHYKYVRVFSRRLTTKFPFALSTSWLLPKPCGNVGEY